MDDFGGGMADIVGDANKDNLLFISKPAVSTSFQYPAMKWFF
jgi:hypothetical protein